MPTSGTKSKLIRSIQQEKRTAPSEAAFPVLLGIRKGGIGTSAPVSNNSIGKEERYIYAMATCSRDSTASTFHPICAFPDVKRVSARTAGTGDLKTGAS